MSLTALTDNDLTLTATAQSKMSELFQQVDETIEGVRVFATPGGCSGISFGMTFSDAINDNDGVLECAGFKVISSIMAMATPVSSSTTCSPWLAVVAAAVPPGGAAADRRLKQSHKPRRGPCAVFFCLGFAFAWHMVTTPNGVVSPNVSPGSGSDG